MNLGLIKSEKISYLTIVNGKIAKACQSDQPDAEKYVTKDGKEKWYIFFSGITGFLESISIKLPPENHPEYSANWILRISANSETFQLQIPQSSGYAHAFFCILPNVNPEEPLNIQPSCRTQIWEGKERESRTIFLKQNGELLKWAHTSKDKRGLPDVEVIQSKGGKTLYDDTERNEFFKNIMNIYNEKRLACRELTAVKDVPTDTYIEYSEDLPF